MVFGGHTISHVNGTRGPASLARYGKRWTRFPQRAFPREVGHLHNTDSRFSILEESARGAYCDDKYRIKTRHIADSEQGGKAY